MNKVADCRGFTLAELVVTMAITGVVAATIYLLLDGGLRVHESGEKNASAVNAMAGVVLLLRGDIARSSSVTHLQPDSLALSLPDGSSVAYGVHSRPGGAYLMRWVNTGSGWTAKPARPAALLRDDDLTPAQLRFTAAGNLIDVDLLTAGAPLHFRAGPWRSP